MLTEKRIKYLETVPSRFKELITRAYRGKEMDTAIKAKCIDCCNYDCKQIDNCNSQICPLWDYRFGITRRIK